MRFSYNDLLAPNDNDFFIIISPILNLFYDYLYTHWILCQIKKPKDIEIFLWLILKRFNERSLKSNIFYRLKGDLLLNRLKTGLF